MKRTLKHLMILVFAVLLATVTLYANVRADTVSGGFAVTATSSGGCTFGTVSDLNFGSYNPLSGNDTTASTNMTFTCVKGQAYSLYITMNDGSSERLLKSDEETLPFELYSDDARTQIFPSQANKLAGTGTGTVTTQGIYGRISAGQNVTKDKTFTTNMTANVDY